MSYPLSKLQTNDLFSASAAATAAVVRLDERIARSSVGGGLLQRFDFVDACASVWADGELVHLDDLVLHDAGQDNRAPSHELTIAKDILRQRRRIAANPPDWPLTTIGVNALRGSSKAESVSAPEVESFSTPTDPLDDLDAQLAAMDSLLNKSEVLLKEIRQTQFANASAKESFIYDLDWNEEERLAHWFHLLAETAHFPPILQCVIALDSWNQIQVFQHGSWLGRLLAASVLRKHQLVTGTHLPPINIALKSIRRENRSVRDVNLRLQHLLAGVKAMADYGLKEHDKLQLARQMMSRRLAGRRSSSRLPQLIELVLSKPVISTELVATTLNITQRASLRLIEELNLREVTGRGRFRAWGIL